MKSRIIISPLLDKQEDKEKELVIRATNVNSASEEDANANEVKSSGKNLIHIGVCEEVIEVDLFLKKEDFENLKIKDSYSGD
jgi:hypothetical protein